MQVYTIEDPYVVPLATCSENSKLGNLPQSFNSHVGVDLFYISNEKQIKGLIVKYLYNLYIVQVKTNLKI